MGEVLPCRDSVGFLRIWQHNVPQIGPEDPLVARCGVPLFSEYGTWKTVKAKHGTCKTVKAKYSTHKTVKARYGTHIRQSRPVV